MSDSMSANRSFISSDDDQNTQSTDSDSAVIAELSDETLESVAGGKDAKPKAKAYSPSMSDSPGQ